MFRIAHISDLHIAPLPSVSVSQIANKRLLGFLSWQHKRKHEHKLATLDALRAHLQEVQPDHICITGDLTNITLPAEVDTATDWLAALGDPARVSLIPGNHDAYVEGALDYALSRWAAWMQDDAGHPGFPYLHRRGPVNIIGLSSAVATLPTLSLGRIGAEQLARTEELLLALQPERRPTLLLVHHPPQNGAASARRALSDRKALQALLARVPVDLILHGHLHYPIRASIAGANGPIPVLGAASASAVGAYKSVAHYHLIDVDTDQGRPRLRVEHYYYDPASTCFSLRETQQL
ncbi:MAG: metallophosphoesterase [Pseudomonadales bacterium]|nr:metallophosphoesterase [Pseudomonadales bacterium]